MQPFFIWFSRALLCIAAGISIVSVPSAQGESGGVIFLENGGVRVGVLPRAGGRVVFFAASGEENYLFSEPALWEKGPDTENFLAFNGHIFWLAPQTGWGKRLDVSGPETPAVWPPDLHLTASLYSVDKQTPSFVRMTSPNSPRSGVRLTKTVEVSDSGVVHLSATMTNCADVPVEWGIWSNTRVAPDAEVFVATAADAPFQVGELPQEQEATPPFAFLGGCVTWLNKEPLETGLKRVVGKLFLHRPSFGAAAILVQEREKMWIKRHALHTMQEMAPGQAPIELYLSLLPDGSGLQEVEAHGPYTKLLPGESTSWAETWTLVERPSGKAAAERAAFAREALRAGPP